MKARRFESAQAIYWIRTDNEGDVYIESKRAGTISGSISSPVYYSTLDLALTAISASLEADKREGAL